jgi:hypothetical protein
MSDFTDLTRQLSELMKASAVGMIVTREGEDGISLNAPIANPWHPKQPLWFGEVRRGKAYVSFLLMPIYANTALRARISPALKKRMQGKSCFNFTKPDPALFAELAELTVAGAAAFLKPLVLPGR